MKLLRVIQRCVSPEQSHHQFNRLQIVKTLSTNSFPGSSSENRNTNSFESSDDFTSRIFDRLPSDSSSSFIQKLDRIQNRNGAGRFSDLHEEDEADDEPTDPLAKKLRKAMKDYKMEQNQDGYSYRPDMNVKSGMTYTPEDLNLRKRCVWKPSDRSDFEVTTEEVLRKADFRNVRFLANFLTEAGIIIKRSQTKISAKAQRKVAREIKTARAFGLLPFTTMGTKEFVFGKTMEDGDRDFQLDRFDHAAYDDAQDPIEG